MAGIKNKKKSETVSTTTIKYLMQGNLYKSLIRDLVHDFKLFPGE